MDSSKMKMTVAELAKNFKVDFLQLLLELQQG
jgi:hypothetical protein